MDNSEFRDYLEELENEYGIVKYDYEKYYMAGLPFDIGFYENQIIDKDYINYDNISEDDEDYREFVAVDCFDEEGEEYLSLWYKVDGVSNSEIIVDEPAYLVKVSENEDFRDLDFKNFYEYDDFEE